MPSRRLLSIIPLVTVLYWSVFLPLPRSDKESVLCSVSLLCPSFAFAEDKEEKPQASSRTRAGSGYAERRKRREERLREKAEAKTAAEAAVGEKKAIGSEIKLDHETFNKEVPKTTGIDVVLVLDSSGSMRRTDPLRLRDQGASLFIRFLSENDRLAVLQFDSEVKSILDLAPIDPKNLKATDDAIASVSVEGRFTDLEAPIAAAFEILRAQGRPEAKRCVILLSDGKMDPHPKKGTSAQLTEKVFSEDLPRFRKHFIKLYTLSLSDQADQAFLARAATEAGGVHEHAPDVNTIHQKFSSLFLALKNPQTLDLDNRGFEIDPGVQEASFYIARQSDNAEIELIDPKGTEITNKNIPPGIRWFKGGMFDVVTLVAPLPGKWTVWGVDNPQGFATLLSEVELQVHWPATHLNAGDNVFVRARLTEKGQVFSAPGLEEALFYTFKIINTATGEVLNKGMLNDKGEQGDQEIGDKLFSTVIQFGTLGSFKAFVTVTAPTFTRTWQSEPLTVSGSMISLSLTKEDAVTHKPESFFVKVSDAVENLNNYDVILTAKETRGGSRTVELQPVEGHSHGFEAATDSLAPGEYTLSARLLHKTSKEVKGASEVLKYSKATPQPVKEETVEAVTPENNHEENRHEENKQTESGHEADPDHPVEAPNEKQADAGQDDSSPQTDKTWIVHLVASVVGVVGALGNVSFLVLGFAGKTGGGNKKLQVPGEYVLDPKIDAKLKELRVRVTQSGIASAEGAVSNLESPASDEISSVNQTGEEQSLQEQVETEQAPAEAESLDQSTAAHVEAQIETPDAAQAQAEESVPLEATDQNQEKQNQAEQDQVAQDPPAPDQPEQSKTEKGSS